MLHNDKTRKSLHNNQDLPILSMHKIRADASSGETIFGAVAIYKEGAIFI